MGKGLFSWSKVLPGKGGACVFVGEGGGEGVTGLGGDGEQ